MLTVRILLTRKDGGISNDDKILIHTHGDEGILFKVSYATPGIRNEKTFLATESRVMDYLEDIVNSLYRDTDPFSHIQVSTCIHPCVMYEIADLYEKDVRDIILGMIGDSLRVSATVE
jgi:hypothetical protein